MPSKSLVGADIIYILNFLRQVGGTVYIWRSRTSTQHTVARTRHSIYTVQNSSGDSDTNIYTTPESDSITVRSAEILILCREMTSYHASEVDSVASSPRSDHSFDQHTRVRFMCSFGGKIVPRPQDNQLRYVGGDTRIVAVHRSTNFSALLAKLSKLSSGTVLPQPQIFIYLFQIIQKRLLHEWDYLTKLIQRLY